MMRQALARLALAVPLFAAAQPALAQPAHLFENLEFRHIGPVGNRVSAVVGVPGEQGTYYAGAASGGIWKTIDGGVRWEPIFDQMDVASVGSLAVAPSDANVVWAGTGESFIRSNVSIGDGIYRSTDAGQTWEHRGLPNSGRIGRIVVHPRDADTVYAAALGHSYGPQAERGLYRTRDGGASWEQILFVDENTGAIDLVMDPSNPRILYAAMWQFEMRTSGRTSGGPGSSIWRSKDGGDTWTRLGPQTAEEHAEDPNGTPKGPWGKIGLTVSADDPKRIYALIETNSNADFGPVEGWDGPGFQGVLWRSEDRGESWSLISRDNTLHQRPLYYTRMAAAPDNANEVTFMSVQQSLSIDGGRSITEQNSGWDHHDIWIDPTDPDRRITGHDGGVSITLDRGRNWLRPQLPIAQMYHVNVDDQVPYFVYGNRQDGDAMRGPSNSLSGGPIPLSAWQSVGGCEVGFAVPEPGDANTVWTGCYDGILEKYDAVSGHSRDVSVKPLAVESWAAKDLEYRFQWSFPIEISPHDPDVVYVGSQFVHRTDDEGTSWSVISPDLSTGDEELMLRSGGLTLDDAGPTVAAVVFAIAESHLEPGQIWAGTNDGRLHLTRDGGSTWTDVGQNLPRALPPLGTISNVEPSRHDPTHAYVTVDLHQENDTRTWVFKTEDLGRTWRSLRANIPQGTHSYAHMIREDPEVPGLLYLGVHNGLWVSLDDGASWRSLRNNLPPAPVSWIEVQEHFGDLVLSTYGRGFWILDDLTPIRWAARTARGENGDSLDEVTLLPIRDAYRFRNVEATQTVPDVPAVGENPPSGVPIHLFIPEGVDEPPSALEITDAENQLARSLDELPTEPGLHRIWWNLRGESTTQAKRSLPPDDNPRAEPGLDAGNFSMLVGPGRYTVTLADVDASETERTADPADPSGQSFELRIDPRSLRTSSAYDLEEQLELVRGLHTDIDRAARLFNQVEDLRVQLRDWAERVESPDTALPEDLDRDELADAITRAATELSGLANEFVDLRLTTARQDSLRWERRLLARFQYLTWRIHQSDHAPTAAQRELAVHLRARLDELDDRFHRFETDALRDLDGELRRLPPLTLQRARSEER